jgi:hypothetical protein
VIDRKLRQGRRLRVAGAVLTFFGFMHSEAIGIGKTPMVAVSYCRLGRALYALSRSAQGADAAARSASHGTPIGRRRPRRKGEPSPLPQRSLAGGCGCRQAVP